MKKNFVLDTNVILHDYKCIDNFQENDIYLPIVVLEELDKFKKGSDQINYNAREFVRELDSITTNDLFTKGASLGAGRGMLHVVTGGEYHPKVKDSFPAATPDHRILSCAMFLSEQHKEMPTILVTKDVNLRMKARSLGIQVEDYITDKVTNVDIFERAQEIYEGIDGDLIDEIYASPQGIPADLYMTYQRNLSTMGVQFTMQGNSTLSFRATPATSFDVVGQWTGTDAAGNTLGLNFDNEEGTCAVTINYADEAQTDVNASGTYSFADGTGAVAYTTAEGQAASIALGLNDKNQLTATTANGTTYVMAR